MVYTERDAPTVRIICTVSTVIIIITHIVEVVQNACQPLKNVNASNRTTQRYETYQILDLYITSQCGEVSIQRIKTVT